MNFTIPVESYTYDCTVNCCIALAHISDSDEEYIFGIPFLRSYYSIFNYSEKKVGLAVNSNAPSGVSMIAATSTPSSTSDSLSGGAIAGIIIGLLVVLVIIVVIICMVNKRKNQARSIDIDGAAKLTSQLQNNNTNG